MSSENYQQINNPEKYAALSNLSYGHGSFSFSSHKIQYLARLYVWKTTQMKAKK